MSHFRQKPARKHKKPFVSRLQSFLLTFKAEKKLRDPRLSRKKHEKTRVRAIKSHKNDRHEKQRSGFSFPVPSLATLAVVAGTIVIALGALKWEDVNFKIPENYIYQPIADTEAEQQIKLYASTGVTGVIPAHGIQNEIVSFKTDFPENAEPLQIPDSIDARNDLITFEWQQYRVRRGDSVSVIAQRYGVSVGAIIASNEIRNARTLQEGVTLRIPNIDGIPYQIKNGDSLTRIAASFNIPLEVILDVNDIKSDNIKPGETLFIPGARMNDIDLRLSLGELFMYPVPSRYVTSPYGMRRDPIGGHWAFHTGIDLRADTGTTVIAALDGIISVVSENRIYGKYIIISHDNGYKTLYAHLNSYTVRQGDRVARGRKIAESGNTGYSTGPHLHFGIYDKNNKLVNPLELLR